MPNSPRARVLKLRGVKGLSKGLERPATNLINTCNDNISL